MSSFLGGELWVVNCLCVVKSMGEIVKDVSNFSCIGIVMHDNLRPCGVAKCFG